MYPRSTSFSIVSARVAGVPRPLSLIASARVSSSICLPACSINRNNPASLSRPFGLDFSSENSNDSTEPSHGLLGSTFHPSGKDCFFGRTARHPSTLMVLDSLVKFSPSSVAVRFCTSHVASGCQDAKKVRTMRS